MLPNRGVCPSPGTASTEDRQVHRIFKEAVWSCPPLFELGNKPVSDACTPVTKTGRRRLQKSGWSAFAIFEFRVYFLCMDISEISRSAHQIWDNRPGVVLLLLLGFLGFLYLVVDTWRHRRHRKRPR